MPEQSLYSFIASVGENATFETKEYDLQSAFLRFKDTDTDMDRTYAVFHRGNLVARVRSVLDRKTNKFVLRLEEWPKRRWWSLSSK